MRDLATRLLAEIERREDTLRMSMMPPMIERPPSMRDLIEEERTRDRAERELAYLAALRKIVALHRPVETGAGPICASCAVRKYPCSTTLTAAEALEVAP